MELNVYNVKLQDNNPHYANVKMASMIMVNQLANVFDILIKRMWLSLFQM